jgi:tRNA modification GTPase
MADFPRFGERETTEVRPLAERDNQRITARSVADAVAEVPLAVPGPSVATKPMAEDPPVWVIQNKIDLLPADASRAAAAAHPLAVNESMSDNELKFISISATNGAGIDQLLARLEAHSRQFFGQESGLVTRERHRSYLLAAQSALARALAEASEREEIVAEELRLASRALGRLTGKIDVEDVLDAIFRDFCIGK